MPKNYLFTFLLMTAMTLGTYATQKTITVQFKAGASSASYKGSVRQQPRMRGELHDSYKLSASKGQLMNIDVTATGPVSLYVWRESMGFNQGYLLSSSSDRKLSTRFILPANDTYRVSVDKGPNGSGIDYDVKFSIR